MSSFQTTNNSPFNVADNTTSVTASLTLRNADGRVVGPVVVTKSADDTPNQQVILNIGNDPNFSVFSWPSLPDPSGEYQSLKPVARWNVVQWQYVSEGLYGIGVSAHHHQGIQKVQFVANGGEITENTQESINPDTGCVEYWCYLEIPANQTDDIEIRARIIPNEGTPRILEGSFFSNLDTGLERNGEYSITLYPETAATDQIQPRTTIWVSQTRGSDSSGTGSFDSPYATLHAGIWSGLMRENTNAQSRKWEIRLEEGEYYFESMNFQYEMDISEGWLNIIGPEWSGDPSLDEPSAIIKGQKNSDGAVTKINQNKWRKIHYTNIKFEIPTFTNESEKNSFGDVFFQGAEGASATGLGRNYAWFDKCFFVGGLQLFEQTTASGHTWNKPANIRFIQSYTSWNTNCKTRNTATRPMIGELIRNCNLDGIFGDAFGEECLLINSSARRVYRTLDMGKEGKIDLPLDDDGNIDQPALSHPDIYQARNPNGFMYNRIIQDLVAIDQISCEGIFLSGQTNFNDFAFVRFEIDNSYNDPDPDVPEEIYNNLMLIDPLSNVLFINGKANNAISFYDGCILDERSDYSFVLFEGVTDFDGNLLSVLPDNTDSCNSDFPDDFINGNINEWRSGLTNVLYRVNSGGGGGSSNSIPVGPGPVSSMPAPEQIGDSSSFGGGSPPISRWNMIALEDISDDPTIGVVSFHVNEVDYVEFSVNGGAWTRVDTPSLNTRTNCEEYHARIDTSSLSLGDMLELRARVYPQTAGVSYNLPIISVNYGRSSLTTYYLKKDAPTSNTGLTPDSPLPSVAQIFSKIRPSGVTTYTLSNHEIVLLGPDDGVTPVEYTSTELGHPSPDYPIYENDWFKIRGEDGVDKSLIRITQSGSASVRVRNLQFSNVTFYEQPLPVANLKNFQDPNGQGVNINIWAHDCDFTFPDTYDDPDTNTQMANTNAYASLYYTNCTASKLGDTFKLANIARNCHAETIVEDCFGGLGLGINLSIDGQTITGDLHPDLLEAFPEVDKHTIYYNVTAINCEGQGIYASDDSNAGFLEHVALVNVFIVPPAGDNRIGKPPTSQYRSDFPTLAISNVLFKNVSTPVTSFNLTSPVDGQETVTITDVLIKDSVFCDLSGTQEAYEDTVIQNCFTLFDFKPDWSNPANINNRSSGGPCVINGSMTLPNTLDERLPSYTSIEDFRPSNGNVYGTVPRGYLSVDATKTPRRDITSIGGLESS